MLKLRQLAAGIACAAMLALCAPAQALAGGTPYQNASEKTPAWADQSLIGADADLHYGECASEIARNAKEGSWLIDVLAGFGYIINTVADFTGQFAPYLANVLNPGEGPSKRGIIC